ncbi:hypothetical protein B0T17DRAFT_594227 [Bombardia bombarda]|uniref:Uncharacterized protein n=1 Tax=Bombardia bombarda TaxID=252184 RepID=A0AA39XIM0_9PEZI|nr:hypothetical protein B0T17DRAFT_594227 [Bombardia bombarda]
MDTYTPVMRKPPLPDLVRLQAELASFPFDKIGSLYQDETDPDHFIIGPHPVTAAPIEVAALIPVEAMEDWAPPDLPEYATDDSGMEWEPSQRKKYRELLRAAEIEVGKKKRKEASTGTANGTDTGTIATPVADVVFTDATYVLKGLEDYVYMEGMRDMRMEEYMKYLVKLIFTRACI